MLARLTLALAFLAANVVAQGAVYGQCESFFFFFFFRSCVFFLPYSTPPVMFLPHWACPFVQNLALCFVPADKLDLPVTTYNRMPLPRKTC